MAEKKRAAAKKKPAAKTSGSRSSTGSRAKSTGGKTTKKKTSAAKRRAKKKAQEELIQSLILFGVGVLLILMLFVPGKSVWNLMRTSLFGVFGVGMYLLGGLLVYLAVCLAQEKPLLPEIGRCVGGLTMLSGVVAVFSNLDTEKLTSFGAVAAAYYKHGAEQMFGAGVAGLPMGGLLLWLCGRPAANVIMIVLAICTLMVIFGVSPAEIWAMLCYYGNKLVDGQKSVVEETKAGYSRRREELLERQQAHQLEMEELMAQQEAQAQEAEEPETWEEPKPGIFARIGSFFSNLFYGAEEELPAERPVQQPAETPLSPVRAMSNRRSVMETALRNAEQRCAAQEQPVPPADEADAPQEEDFVFAEPDPIPENGPAVITPRRDTGEPDFILPEGMRYMAPEPPVQPAPVPPVAQTIVPATTLARTPDTIPPQPSVQPAAPAEPAGCTVVLPQTPAGPGPAKIQPAPLEPVDNGEWMSITDAPPVGQVAAIADLTQAAMNKAAAAEQAAAATPVPEQPAHAAYRYPPLSLFDPQKEESEDARAELQANAEKLVSTLDSFGVKTRILDISRGPSVTRYELQPRAGVKISRITSLADDIALNLAVADVRIEAPIPGKPAVGIEVPNRKSTSVAIRSILESSNYSHMASPLTIALGKDIAGVAQVADLCKMPHLLIAGSTGSGKSVCVNSIIISFIYRSSPEDLKLILIDPKVVELAEYNGIPHLLMPVVTEPRKAAGALCSAVGEMERRYRLFADNNVRDIKTYNKAAAENPALEKLPYIAIIIDELADLMMVAGKEVEDYICRIAQKARAAGMHLIVATQRPSVDVITGLIKANIPSRIAFAVSSQVDSRTILDGAGAEKLLGMGDMLFLPVGASKPIRIQGTYVTDAEITRTLDFIKAEQGAEYDETMIAAMEKAAADNGKSGGNGGSGGDDDSDPMLGQCVECVIDAGQASTSLLQRRCKLGYARAARIMDEMEEKGIIGPYEGAKPRAVLISRQQWIERNLNRDTAVPEEI